MQMTEQQSLNLLIENKENKENAYSIEHFFWTPVTTPAKDSHIGAFGTTACIAGWNSHLSETNPS